MDANMRRKINDIVDIITKELGIEVPITNIEKVVSQLKGQVIKKDYLSEGADGAIYRQYDGFVIEVPTINNLRENFTIAHELGHLFLHMGYLIDAEMWEKNKNKVYLRKEIGEMEYQAHEFAAALLMPREKFFNSMNDNYNGDGTYNVGKVAEYFNVSYEAAINRGRWLGILEWM